MTQPAEHIDLSDVDSEHILMGSLIESHETFIAHADGLRPEWFADELARYMFDTCRSIVADGCRVAVQTVIERLPANMGAMSRGQYFASLSAAALPSVMLPSLVHGLRERWARRELIALSDRMRSDAVSFDADPYKVASDAIVTVDEITSVREGRATHTMAEAVDGLFEDIRNADAMRGFSTGLAALDNKLNGYQRGQLYVFAGRPGMGKSALMCSSLRRTAASGVGVAIVSLEMPRREVSARMISDQCDHVHAPGFGDILRWSERCRQHEDRIMDARTAIRELPIVVDDCGSMTCAEIAARARRVKAEMHAQGIELGVLCIDHMGLITPTSRYGGNKVAETSEVSNFLRALAKELDCCVLALCQLSREVEKRGDNRPTLSDLRWSGEIEQDAHVVAFLFREAYYLEQDPNHDLDKMADARWRLDILIRKNRNGSPGDVRLWCSIAHSSLRDIA